MPFLASNYYTFLAETMKNALKRRGYYFHVLLYMNRQRKKVNIFSSVKG